LRVWHSKNSMEFCGFGVSEFFNSIGRKQPVNFSEFRLSERPLSMKADIQILVSEYLALNVRFSPGSRRSGNIG